MTSFCSGKCIGFIVVANEASRAPSCNILVHVRGSEEGTGTGKQAFVRAHVLYVPPCKAHHCKAVDTAT